MPRTNRKLLLATQDRRWAFEGQLTEPCLADSEETPLLSITTSRALHAATTKHLQIPKLILSQRKMNDVLFGNL